MEELEKFIAVVLMNRRMGNTTALAKAAIDSKGVLVCYDSNYAQQVKREHRGVDARGWRERLDDINGPLLADNSLLQMITREYSNAIADAERRDAYAKALKKESEADRRMVSQLQLYLHNSNRAVLAQRLRLDSYVRRDVNRKIRSRDGFKSFFTSL